MLAYFRRLVRHELFFPIAVVAVYFVVNLILVLHHEQWRGETNPWQIAKVLNLENMIEVVRTEPQSLLWILILTPLAKLGLPLVTANVVSLLIMSFSVFLLARHAPFSRLSVVVLALSAVFLYFNPVIAGGYCLVVLGMVVAVCIYRTRRVVALVVAGASALMVLPAAIETWQGWSANRQTDWLVALNQAWFGVSLPVFELVVMFVLTYAFFNYLRRPAWLHRWAQKLEIAKLLKRVPAVALVVIPAAVTIPLTLTSALSDMSTDYSYSRKLAEYINAQTPPGAVVLTGSADSAGVAAGLVMLLEDDRKVYDIGSETYMNFYLRTTYPEVGQEDLRRVTESLAGNEVYYLASAYACAVKNDTSLTLLETFESSNELREGTLSLYQVAIVADE